MGEKPDPDRQVGANLPQASPVRELWLGDEVPRRRGRTFLQKASLRWGR